MSPYCFRVGVTCLQASDVGFVHTPDGVVVHSSITQEEGGLSINSACCAFGEVFHGRIFHDERNHLETNSERCDNGTRPGEILTKNSRFVWHLWRSDYHRVTLLKALAYGGRMSLHALKNIKSSKTIEDN